MRRALVLVLLAVATVLPGCGGTSDDRVSPPELGDVAASGAGHRFYEVYDPAGPPRGTMLVVHGGGWRDQRGDARRMMAAAAVAFRTQGWRVLNVGYSPGPRAGGRIDPRPMLRDVVAFYDQARRAYDGPVCAYGESAGGHLTAMLSLERPSLRCAVLAAAPLDLAPLVDETTPDGVAAIRATFGTLRSRLEAWSPARLSGSDGGTVPVFATAAANDLVVPPDQLAAFRTAQPEADTELLPEPGTGAQAPVPWMHSSAGQGRLDARLAALDRWLEREVPRSQARRPATAPTDTGSGCLTPGADRARLLRSGEAWRQSSTVGQPLAATRGCSGTARWQDDGLSLWAYPRPGATLPTGSQAALTLSPGRVIRRLTATFRGFLARPADWTVGLYASTRSRGAVTTPVAVCDRGRCSGLRRFDTAAGALLAAAGTGGDPDARATGTTSRFSLPAGTRRVAWGLRCVAPAGCSLAGLASTPAGSTRPRDPLGHPAIFSLYRVAVG